MPESRDVQAADDRWSLLPSEVLTAMTRVVMYRSDRQKTPDGRAATCGVVRFSGTAMKPVSVAGSGPFPMLLSDLLETTLTVPAADHEVVVFWVKPKAHVEDLRHLIGPNDLPKLPRKLTIAVGVEGSRSVGGSGVVLTSLPPERLTELDATFRALMETAIGFRKALERH